MNLSELILNLVFLMLHYLSYIIHDCNNRVTQGLKGWLAPRYFLHSTSIHPPPTMSHPQAPQRQPTPSETQRYVNTIHNVALVAVIACPILALLPPRKLDVYTIGLIGTTAYSGNYLVRERSGRSMWQYVVNGSPSPAAAVEPSVSPTEQASLEKELQYAKQEMHRLNPSSSPSVSAEVQAAYTQREAWKAQRNQEIQDDLDVGKGIGEMITDQVWEVWNWGRGKGGEDE